MTTTAERGYHEIETSEVMELFPTGLCLVTAAHDGQDNWQFVQRGLPITAGPPALVLAVLSDRNRTTELLNESGEFGMAICSIFQGDTVAQARKVGSGRNVDDKF